MYGATPRFDRAVKDAMDCIKGVAHADERMGDYCAHCGYKAGSHKHGTMNCPKNGPGSSCFNPDKKFESK